jgi:hypothetical protein
MPGLGDKEMAGGPLETVAVFESGLWEPPTNDDGNVGFKTGQEGGILAKRSEA